MTDQADNHETAAAAAPESRVAETANVNLAALVTDVVKFLVDSPEEVSVEEINEGSRNVVLELSVEQKDVGKVIGKQGRTVRSLRNLLDAAASKLGKRATLEIMEDDDDDEQGDDGDEQIGNVDENIGNR